MCRRLRWVLTEVRRLLQPCQRKLETYEIVRKQQKVISILKLYDSYIAKHLTFVYQPFTFRISQKAKSPRIFSIYFSYQVVTNIRKLSEWDIFQQLTNERLGSAFDVRAEETLLKYQLYLVWSMMDSLGWLV
ncbi:Hypothetical_protein [Hexamita inflata]|uniref:Hypothetical_protein n=1 Tax=Hexamita inflata TaxID=28002 RepID=A0AA86PLB9_9EUKA|nr:Hypothetical protein HINF_LOCUS29810 [Hexamita inflata]